MLSAQLSREDFIAYCKVSSGSLSDECKQILMEARTEQWTEMLPWIAGLLGIVLVVWVLQKTQKRLRVKKTSFEPQEKDLGE